VSQAVDFLKRRLALRLARPHLFDGQPSTALEHATAIYVKVECRDKELGAESFMEGIGFFTETQKVTRVALFGMIVGEFKERLGEGDSND